MKASDLFVKCLENEGVEYIFGIPGEENIDFLESLRHSTIKLILNRHEQGAGFMAATYGRLTGKTGVCISTLGPGATNFATCAAYAQLGAMPMMMITGQKPILRSKQGHFQIVDMVEMFRPVTKYAEQVKHGDRIPSMVREAFRRAESERPGAVHLELPEDIAAAEGTTLHPLGTEKTRRPDANDKAVKAAVVAIEEAKNPLILIGAGANRKQIGRMLASFVEKTNIPFFTTQMGKGVLPDDHPRCLGTAALSAGDYLHNAVGAADCIINIGHDVIEKPPFFMKEDDMKVIHVSFSPAEMDEVYFPQHEVVGDIANALWKMNESITPADAWDFSYTEKVKAVVDQKLVEGAEDAGFPVKPQRYVADIRAVLDREDIICLDNGIYKLWFARNYPALAPNTVLLDNALATMGAGLPSAMMAKMVRPDQNVIAICGDGGFMMNSQELETAVRLDLDIVVLVLNNKNYQMIKWKQDEAGFPDFGLDFQNPDFIQYANSYGAIGHRVNSADEFKPLLEKCFAEGGVHLIDLPVDDSPHYDVLTKELKQHAKSI